MVAFRVSASERDTIEDAAHERGLTLSDLLREAALGSATASTLRRARRSL